MPTFKGNIICPNCKAKHLVVLHKNVCMTFFQCDNCKTLLKAKEGCCVFCDYGDKPCPVAPHEQPTPS